MSGGSMDYLYYKVRDAKFELNTPLRRAFHAHLQLVAQALKDIEWVDSGDCGPGDDELAIKAVLSPEAVLTQLLTEAKAALEALGAEVAKAETMKGRS